MNDISKKKKRPYSKPKLVVAELAVDEVLAVACKMVQMAGPIGVGNCMASQCWHRGS